MKQTFLFSLLLLVIRNYSSAEKITLGIDLNEPVAVTDPKFLSFTIDPVTLLAGNAVSTHFERSVNLMRALSPAYLRLGGPRSTLFHFADQNSEENGKKRKIVLSESDWVLAHQWAEKAGLDVIACVSPDDRRRRTIEGGEDALEIIPFSDHMGFNANWQLGYEPQIRCNLTGNDLGRQTLDLRKSLNQFPRYSNSVITGPDVVIYDNEKHLNYLRDYFSVAIPALSAITWHPDLASITLDNGGAFIHQDNLEEDKEELLKAIGRFVDDRPLWIAESRPEECKNLYIGALILARRLGNSARANVNVIMRQPADLTYPTPDYWVSLLHKTLVGRQVFDAKIRSVGNEDHTYLYCQCASNRHEDGSIVIFGVNLNPSEVAFHLEGINATERVHEYVLTPGFDAPNRMFAETIFLNDKLLTLINDTVPEMRPKILNDTKTHGVDLRLQSGSIGFWIIPNLKIKSCMGNEAPRTEERTAREDKIDDKNTKETSSPQGRGASSSDIDKRKRRGDASIYRNSIKRELKRLKRFVKKKLDDYDYAKSLPKLFNSKEQGGKGSTLSQEDVQSKLKEYKDRVTRLRNLMGSSDAKMELRKSIGDLVGDVISLMLKIQNALETMRKEIDRENKTESFTNVKETLKSLYDLLMNANLSNESIDSREMERGLDRAKRELLPFDSKRRSDNLSRKRGARDEDVEEGSTRGIERWWSKKKQPSFLELDSEEDADFYRFDNSFVNEDSFLNTYDYDYEFEDSEEQVSTMEYIDDVRTWNEDDGSFYHEPVQLFKNSRNNRMKTSTGAPELWEVEAYEVGRKDRRKGMVRIESDGTIRDSKFLEKFEGVSFPKNHRPTYTNVQPDESAIRSFFSGRAQPIGSTMYKRIPDFSALKGSNPWTDYLGNKRSKRGETDLRAILDQEMIKEDDANSKDCNCRVIRRSETCDCRSRRGAIESLESLEVDTVAPPKQQLAGLDKDIVRANLREDTDVEVFAELEEGGPKIEKSTRDEVDSSEIGEGSRNARDPRHDSNIPALESRSDLHPEVASSADHPRFSSIILNEEKEEDRSSERSVRRDASKFLSEEESTTVNNEEYTFSNQENSTDFTEGDEETEDGTKEESWIETTTALSEGIVRREEAESNYDDVSSKRGAKSEQPLLGRKATKVGTTDFNKSKKRAPRLNVARQSELSKKVRTLQALRDLFRKLKESRVLLPIPRSRSAERGAAAEYRRTRAQQVKQLRDKLRDKRQMMLRKYERGVREAVDKEENVEKRNLRRREAWERIKGSQDFRDMIDREKLAYMLMYRPTKYDEERREVGESEEDDVPATEISLRNRDTWRRIFKNDENFRDRSYDNLDRDVVRSEDLPSSGEKRGEGSDEGERRDDVYFALVEDVERPRIYYYEENPGSEGKRIMRASPRRSPNHAYNRLLQNNLGSIKVVRYSDDEEESDQPPEGKEIYIIDPSRYKGGDPSLQLYKSSRISPDSQKTPSKRYKIIWKPIVFKPFRIRQSTQRKREDKSGEESTENLLNDFIDYLDPKTVDELLKSGNVIVDDKMENFMHSIVEKQEPVTRSEDDREFEEANEENSDSKGESSKIVEQQGESYRNVTEGRIEGGNISETSNITSSDNGKMDSKKMEIKRKRRNAVTESRQGEYFESLPPLFSLRKTNNYSSRSKQSSKEISDENLLLRIEQHTKSESNTEKSKREGKGASLSLEKSPLSDEHGTALAWMERSGRRVQREAAENREKMDENTNVEKIQPSELQHLDEAASSTKIPAFGEIDDVEKSLIQKIPLEKFMPKGSIDRSKRKNVRRNKKEDDGLSSLIEKSLPKIGNVVIDGLNKAENFTGSVEQLIKNLDENYNRTIGKEDRERDSTSTRSIDPAQNVFRNAITNVKKFFMLLNGVTNILRNNG
ncbi:uncharacterized protein LOC100576569 [Apis mellifera]|uniref:Uncharacterized protein LOC100576569 n=1 Tax=Apis mellifera TaxID=7460 RepID=A0A7M7GAH7_APIME|nr:uncharacterized protein LOC100576569 [Apis mellifera]|eukprot:XP_003250264.2 uncharacterized protein LOC100576569 [Apis mellifera]